MKSKGLLAAFLLGVGLCFVPALGHGEIKGWMIEKKASIIDFMLLDARIRYLMWNPTNFLYVDLYYDEYGVYGTADRLPESLDTKDKIYVQVADTRGVFSYEPKKALLSEFKRQLELIYSFIEDVATDMDTDIVAIFFNRKERPLGYFYQGKYHLWEE